MCMEDFKIANRRYIGNRQYVPTDDSTFITLQSNINRVAVIVSISGQTETPPFYAKAYKSTDDMGGDNAFFIATGVFPAILDHTVYGQDISGILYFRAWSSGSGSILTVTEILVNKNPGPDGLTFY